MGNSTQIEDLVERAVGEVLDIVMPGLREQIVHRVVEILRREGSVATIASGDSSALNRALATIQTGTTQVQILDALLDASSQFTSRSALFVVRGGNAVGWRAKGFHEDDAVRLSPVDLHYGLPAKALREHAVVSGPSSEFTADFVKKFGAPTHEAMVAPLVVRDKVVAILYADGGLEDHRMDRPALEALVRSTGLWLEVFATRKVSGPVAETEHPVAMAAAAPTPSAPEVHAPVVESRPHVEEPAHESESVAETTAPTVAREQAALSGADSEVHKKAKRFAKLLVDEIKLYNQGKVSEGRQNRDLYDRLKEDIEKSRASYDKRYGNTAAKDGDYFNQELVRILADNDPRLLGGNFQR
jgi:hypothetical protein